MPLDVRKVASGVHVAFLLYCMALLGWADLDSVTGVVLGFPLSGCMDRPIFFRTTYPQTSV